MGEDQKRSERTNQPSSQVQHLARQTMLLLSSGLVSYAGAFGLNVLLARTLGASGFGAWVVAFSVSQLISGLGLMGADWILLRQGSHYHGAGDTARLRATVHLALLLSIVTLGVMGIVLLLLAPTLSQSVFKSQSIVGLLRLTAFIGPIMGVRQIMLFGTQAFKDMRDVALNRNILQPVARIAVTAVALLIRPTPFSAYVGLLVAEIALAGAAGIALQRRLPLFGPTDDIERKELIKFALPVWGSSLIELFRGQLFPVLIGSLATLSASAVFVAGRRIAVAPVSVIASMNQVFSPMGSDLFLQGRREELIELFKSITKWSFSIGFPIFCLQVAFPKALLSLFGKGFPSGSNALIVQAIGMLFAFGSGPVTITLLIAGRSRLAFIDYVIVVAVEIALGIWLIPAYGVTGAAIAKTTGTALNNLLPLLQIRFMLKFHPYRWDFLKPVGAGLVAIAVSAVVVKAMDFEAGVISVVTATALTGVVYVSLMALFGLSQQDRAVIAALMKRGRRAAGTAGAAPIDTS